MRKQGDIGPAVVFSAIVGFLNIRQIIDDISYVCIPMTNKEG